MHDVLEVAHTGDLTSRVVDVFLVTLVATNVLAVILESVESYSQQYEVFFTTFEQLSVLFFSLEYGLRVWAIAEAREYETDSSWKRRLQFMFTPLALADLLAILPFYVSGIFGVDLHSMRVLRLLRIFKLTRYSAAMTMVLSVFRSESRAFGAALFILFVALIFAASGIYLAEADAQPEALGSIPAAMWWAVATLTTVGYGDVTPITPMGKLFASAVTIIGIGVVALPAGLLASGFSELHRSNRQKFAREAESSLEDGVITGDEARGLDELSASLGISSEDTDEILEHARHFMDQEFPTRSCPHCGKALA
ncbi:MAG: ion transporter [bacterium]|nr:ion transporter [bacterium]